MYSTKQEMDIEVERLIRICFKTLKLQPIEVSVTASLRGKWGVFQHGADSKKTEVMSIAIDTKKMFNRKAYEQVRLTTLHEIAHYYQLIKLGYTCHDMNFYKMESWLLKNVK